MSQAELVRTVLRLLAALGVRECCVAAGARNAPVIAALLKSGGVRVRHFFEERGAAFFALGRVMDSARPVAVVTTSGTAAAELLPAMIEAHYQGVPLIAVTADRPRHYRGSGAPQAIEQAGLFGSYVSRCLDLDVETLPPDASECAVNAPLHVNLCLDEPLATDIEGIDFDAIPVTPRVAGEELGEVDLSFLTKARRPAVLAAGLTVQEALTARPLLVSLRAPVLAEATSNLWSPPAFNEELAPWLLPSTDEVYRALAPDALLRLGTVPTLRAWRDLEAQIELPVAHFSRALFPGLARKQGSIAHPWAALPKAAPACASWHGVMEKAGVEDDSEMTLLRALSRWFTANARVFLGNSLPIREMNALMEPQAEGVTFFANRGANGIDGLISTWLGLDAEEGGDSWLILGDLSALYDLAGPWILPQLARRRRFLVVVNNGGGRIFRRVAGLRALPETARAVIENRHALSFRPFAGLWGMGYVEVRAPADLEMLDGCGAGAHVVELKI